MTIHSSINKGINHVDCKRFQDILFHVKLDGIIYKKEQGKEILFTSKIFSSQDASVRVEQQKPNS